MNLTWFRFPLDFMINRKFRQLSPEAKVLYFAVLTVCAKAKFITTETDENELEMYSGLKKKQIMPNLIILHEKGVIDAHLRNTSLGIQKERKREKKERQILVGFSPIDLMTTWNVLKNKLPKALSLSPKREAQARARLKENPSREYWSGIISRIVASGWCNGKNDRGWKADFDFLLKPDTHLKALEGKYDNREDTTNVTPISETVEERNARINKWAEENPV